MYARVCQKRGASNIHVLPGIARVCQKGGASNSILPGIFCSNFVLFCFKLS